MNSKSILREIKGVNRKDIYEIPFEALREAVANAIFTVIIVCAAQVLWSKYMMTGFVITRVKEYVFSVKLQRQSV